MRRIWAIDVGSDRSGALIVDFGCWGSDVVCATDLCDRRRPDCQAVLNHDLVPPPPHLILPGRSPRPKARYVLLAVDCDETDGWSQLTVNPRGCTVSQPHTTVEELLLNQQRAALPL